MLQKLFNIAEENAALNKYSQNNDLGIQESDYKSVASYTKGQSVRFS